MSLQLRGHHLLCLVGFRGMGYSPKFTENMAAIYEQLRQEPSTLVQVVRGADDLCSCYPKDKPNHCDTQSVHARDTSVLERLGLPLGSQVEWRAVLKLLEKNVVPEDIPRLCASCPWQPYGVCEAGVALIAGGQPLPPLP
jgi:hypothetical protein